MLGRGEIRGRSAMGRARMITLMSSMALVAGIPHAAGNLAGQNPIEVVVELGRPGQHVFVPNQLRFETGKLYKLVLKNPSAAPHYFTSNGFTQLVFHRKAQ